MAKVIIHRKAFDKIHDAAGELLLGIGLQLIAIIGTSWSPRAPSRKGRPPAVRTGNLKSSITLEMSNGTVVVLRQFRKPSLISGHGANWLRVGPGPSAPYGVYLELGTQRVSKRPWLVPAFRKLFRVGLRKPSS